MWEGGGILTATEKAQIIKDAVDTLGTMLPLEWHNSQGKLITILQTGIGILNKGIIYPRSDGGEEPVWFRVSIDGILFGGDGWCGYQNPPISVADGTYHDEVDEITGEIIQISNYKIDPLAAFFEFIEQVVN